MLHVKDIPSVYWANIKGFWLDSFKTPVERSLSIITLIKWFVKLIFFIPNIIIFPIIWTIIDFYSKEPLSEQSNQLSIDSIDTSQGAPIRALEIIQDSFLLEKNEIQSTDLISPMIWQLHHDDNPLELVSLLFSTIHAIKSSEYNCGYSDFNLALKTICERYLIIYTDDRFSFASKDHESISIPALQAGMRNLLTLGKEIIKTLPPTDPYRFDHTLYIYKYLVKPFCRAALNYLNEKEVDDDTIFSVAKIQRQYRDWFFPIKFGFNRPNYNEIQAAVIIQRGFRKYQYAKTLLTHGSIGFSKEYSQDEIEHYKKYFIQLDQSVPQEQKQLIKKPWRSGLLHTQKICKVQLEVFLN